MTYETILPNATYAPWRDDAEFLKAHAMIDGHTLVDMYRCWELWNLVRQTGKLYGGVYVEVGTWKGGTGAIIAAAARTLTGKFKTYLFDTFSGVVKAGKNDSVYEGGEHDDASRLDVEAVIENLCLEDDVWITTGVFPEETGYVVSDCYIRFAHIDVDTYQSAKDATEFIWPRLLEGGMVVYDDYGWADCDGITKLVNEYIESKNDDRIIIYNLNGHAIMIKVQ